MSPPDASTASPGPESAAGPKYKLITCILPKGAAMPVVEKLRAEMKITTANVGNARGVGRLTPLAYRGVGEQTEKEVLTVAVPGPAADEVFEFVYYEADINRPHGGLMYMGALSESTLFTLPDLPEEE